MTQKYYNVEFNVVEKVLYACMVVQAENKKEAEQKVSQEVYRQYNSGYGSERYADVSLIQRITRAEAEESELNTIVDLE